MGFLKNDQTHSEIAIYIPFWNHAIHLVDRHAVGIFYDQILFELPICTEFACFNAHRHVCMA